MTPEKKRRRLRAGIALGATFVATWVVGFGGLALWTVVTENDNSSFSNGAVHHTNTAAVTAGGSVTCDDNQTLPATTCGIIFDVVGASPGFSRQVGTVQITNTGSIPTTFQLSLKSAVVSGAGTTLCGTLQVSISDSEAPPVTVYSGGLSAMPAQSLARQAGGLTWNSGDSDTFAFTLTLPTTSPSSDQNSTCTVDYLWTQSSV